MAKKKSAKKAERSAPKTQKGEAEKAGVRHTKIRVIGIGGGGGNIVAEVAPRVPRIDFWAANTDVHALKRTGKACHKFVFGQSFTGGLGCGGSAKMGAAAAKQAGEKIRKLFRGVDLCILVACLGGGTGSGAVAEFAQLAKKEKCLTLGVFTLPFRFEGEKRMQTARSALAKTIPLLSASIVFPNEKIFHLLERTAGFQAALSSVNTILARDLKNLMDVIYSPGVVNIDFADLRSLLAGEGRLAYLASASGGESAHSVAQGASAHEGSLQNRAEIATKALLSHPLNEYNPKGAESILLNIAAGKDISIAEVQSVSNAVCALNPHAKLIFGVSHPPKLKKSLVLTLFAVGKAEAKGGKKKGRRTTGEKESKGKERRRERPKDAAESAVPPIEKEKKKEQAPHKPQGKKRSLGVQQKQVQQKQVPQKQDQQKQEKKTEKTRKQSAPNSKQRSEQIQVQVRARKSALDLRKEIELAAKKQEEQEKRWDIPAFLRRNIAL